MIKLNRPECPNPGALKTNYKYPANKVVLIESCHGKCMYCESKIAGSQFGDVEHIKPKIKFPSLEFEWNNLGYVCIRCNNKKLDKYFDDNPFINPYEENPDDFLFAAGPMIFSIIENTRGEVTLKSIDLNRSDLMESRAERIKELKELVERYTSASGSLKQILKDEIYKEVGSDKEYSMCKKYFIENYVR